MTNEALNQVIADYYRDFSTLNVQAILPYFNKPSLLVGTHGVIPIADRAALVAVFGPVMEGLRAKGYIQRRRSEKPTLSAKPTQAKTELEKANLPLRDVRRTSSARPRACH